MTPAEVDEICHRNLLDTSDEVIYFKDLDSRFVRVSLGCARAYGLRQDELVGMSDDDLFPAEHAAITRADELEVIRTGKPMLNKQEDHRIPGRPEAWVSSSKFPLHGPDGAIIGTFGISRDVTPLVLAQQEAARLAETTQAAVAHLRQVEARLRAVLNGSTDAIAKYDTSLRYEYINPAGERSRGATMAELVGRTDRETGMADGPLAVWEPALQRVAETGETDEIEFSVADDHGVESWFHTLLTAELGSGGEVVGVLASTRDVSELKRAELALAHQATHDPVTGVANRYLLTDRLAQAVSRMEHTPGRIALFFVDLDHFKNINDTYGHEVGDRVLVEFARRLERVARRQDTVARLGGDEFVLLCEDVGGDADVEHIADRIVRVLAAAYHEPGLTVRLSASVGAVMSDDPQTSASELLRSADSAMYRAKDGGRNQFQVFDPALEAASPAGGALERDLRTAVEEDQLRLVYRPLLSLGDQRVLGFEAAVRWEHPTRGLLEPADFLTGLEERGLLGLVGAWELETACAQLARWQTTRSSADAALVIAVHVSERRLQEPAFVQRVLEVLDRYGLSPDALRLGFSERTLVHGAWVRDRLLELTAAGVRLAVDDFGSTYRTLGELPYIPVGVVNPGPPDAPAEQRGVVTAVVATAHSLGMSVIGEGIETTPELVDLVRLVGDDGQGFLLGVPLDPGEAGRLLVVDAGRDGTRHTDAAGLR